MIKNLSPKVIVLAIIWTIVLLMSGMTIETTRGALFEIRNSVAAMEAAKASNKAAEAATLDAINKLAGTIATSRAMNHVGDVTAEANIAAAERIAAATMKAAEINREALVTSTSISMHPDNETYDSFTGPLLGEPTKKIARLNDQIRRLTQRAQRATGDKERFEYMEQIARLEEEKEIVGQTASQNVGDVMNLMMGGVLQMFGGTSKPSANAQASTPKARGLAQ